MRRIGFVLALALFTSTTAVAHKAIFLVRHAEKESQTDPDSGISITGEDRALGLARMLRNAGVTHVFVSDKKRTAQTARSLVDQKGLTPEVTAAADTKALVVKLKAVPKDAVVVVVGHSDTLPEILAGLGVKGEIKIKDDQFGRIFVIASDGALIELAY